MNIPLIVLIIMTTVLGIAATWVAVLDARADRRHAQWMRRNELRRRRTQVAVQGIRYQTTGLGLDGEAAHTGATQKHTAP